MASFLSTHNVSLYTIPAAWLLCILPHFYAISLAGKSFDNRSPRTLAETLKNDQTLDSATKATILRAEGAQQNGFENLGLYAAAIVAGNAANLPPSTLSSFSLFYVASRAAYDVLYINNRQIWMANLRGVVFFGGVGACLGLFIKSGNVLVRGGGLELLV